MCGRLSETGERSFDRLLPFGIFLFTIVFALILLRLFLGNLLVALYVLGLVLLSGLRFLTFGLIRLLFEQRLIQNILRLCLVIPVLF